MSSFFFVVSFFSQKEFAPSGSVTASELIEMMDSFLFSLSLSLNLPRRFLKSRSWRSRHDEWRFRRSYLQPARSHYISHTSAPFPKTVASCHSLRKSQSAPGLSSSLGKPVVADCHCRYTPEHFLCHRVVCAHLVCSSRVSTVCRAHASRAAARRVTLTDVTPVLTSNRHLDSECSHIQ